MYGLRHCVLEDFQNVVVCASDGWVPTFGGMLKRLGKAVTIANELRAPSEGQAAS